MKYSFFFILIEFGDFFAAIYSFHSVKKTGNYLPKYFNKDFNLLLSLLLYGLLISFRVIKKAATNIKISSSFFSS